jgi:hypothetical protein
MRAYFETDATVATTTVRRLKVTKRCCRSRARQLRNADDAYLAGRAETINSRALADEGVAQTVEARKRQRGAKARRHSVRPSSALLALCSWRQCPFGALARVYQEMMQPLLAVQAL